MKAFILYGNEFKSCLTHKTLSLDTVISTSKNIPVPF